MQISIWANEVVSKVFLNANDAKNANYHKCQFLDNE